MIRNLKMIGFFAGLIACYLPVFSQGTTFSTFPDWKTVVQTATDSNRYIFVDVYATWCGPCKIMDRDVLSKNSVGVILNQKYIPIKIQLDSSKTDDTAIRSWYGEAAIMKHKYKIGVLPTYLIFSPRGELVYRTSGAKTIQNFLEIIRSASDGSVNIESLKSRFEEGKLEKAELQKLIALADKLQDDTLSYRAALAFKKSYLDGLPQAAMMNKDPLDFLVRNYKIISTNDKWFRLFEKNGGEIDSLLKRPEQSYLFMRFVIQNELGLSAAKLKEREISNIFWTNTQNTLRKRFGKELAVKMMLDIKRAYYYSIKDYKNFIPVVQERYDRFGIDTCVMINMMDVNAVCFNDVLKHSNDPKQLLKAVTHMEIILQQAPKTPEWRDTYARLLYRLGRKEEAIKNELQAINDLKLFYANKNRPLPPSILQEYLSPLNQMQTGTLNDYQP